MYYWKLSIDRAEEIQQELVGILTALENYKPINPEYINEKSKLLDNARRFCYGK